MFEEGSAGNINTLESSVSFLREGDIEDLAGRVTKALKDSPHSDVPPSGRSTEFWDTISLFKLPDVSYGDVEVSGDSPDRWGNRRTFSRDILNKSGQKIGRWTKFGFLNPDDKFSYFSEWVKVDTGKIEVQVHGFTPDDPTVYGIRRKVYDQNSGLISDQDLSYRYGENGKVTRTMLIERDNYGNEVGEKLKLGDDSEWIDMKAARAEAAARQSAPTPVVETVTSTPAPPAATEQGQSGQWRRRLLSHIWKQK